MLNTMLIIFLLVISVPIIGIVIEEDHWFWGSVLSIASVATASWWFDLAIFSSMKNNPIFVLHGALIYILIGIVWAIIKFYMKSKKLKEDDFKSCISPEKKLIEVFETVFKKVPSWIAFWPFVLIWDIISDWLKSFFEWIADTLKAFFMKIFKLAIAKTFKEVTEKSLKK